MLSSLQDPEGYAAREKKRINHIFWLCECKVSQSYYHYKHLGFLGVPETSQNLYKFWHVLKLYSLKSLLLLQMQNLDSGRKYKTERFFKSLVSARLI